MTDYKQNGDYQIPNISLTESQPLGKYGRMRKKFLKEHRPILYNQMLLSESLYPHLKEIEETMNRQLEQTTEEMARTAGITEKLKASDPLAWVGQMNALRAQAEEILLRELIYS